MHQRGFNTCDICYWVSLKHSVSSIHTDLPPTHNRRTLRTTESHQTILFTTCSLPVGVLWSTEQWEIPDWLVTWVTFASLQLDVVLGDSICTLASLTVKYQISSILADAFNKLSLFIVSWVGVCLVASSIVVCVDNLLAACKCSQDDNNQSQCNDKSHFVCFLWIDYSARYCKSYR